MFHAFSCIFMHFQGLESPVRYLETLKRLLVTEPEQALELATQPARGGRSRDVAEEQLEMLGHCLHPLGCPPPPSWSPLTIGTQRNSNSRHCGNEGISKTWPRA